MTIKGSLLSDPALAREMVNLVAQKGDLIDVLSTVLILFSSVLGIEVRTKTYPLRDIETLMQDYHKENHAGKLVLRVSEDI